MAEQDFAINITVNTGQALRNTEAMGRSLSGLGRELKTLGRDVAQVSREVVQFSGAITGAFSASFLKAKTDIPAVDMELKKLNNSFHAISDSIASAALPSLISFGSFLNGLAAGIGSFAEKHGEAINQFLKYSAITFAVSTFSFAIAKLLKFLGETILLFGKFGALIGLTNPVMLTLAGAVLALAVAIDVLGSKSISTGQKLMALATSGPLGIGALFGATKGQNLKDQFEEIKKALEDFLKSFEEGMTGTAKRVTNVLGEFARGFQSTLNTLRQNIFNFGAQVSQAFETAFGEGIFNAITGRFQGLRAIVIQLGNDIARALSRGAANQLLSALFGDKEGERSGLLGGLIPGGLMNFFRGSPGKRGSDVADNSKRVSKNFDELVDNMKKFAKVKDEVIENLKKFRDVLAEVTASVRGGASAAATPAAAGLSLDAGSFESLNKLNETLAVTNQLVAGIHGGFQATIASIQSMAKVYVAAQAIMLGVSVAAAAVTKAVMTSVAKSLASAWLPAAVLASIATFGAAALVGSVSVIAGLAGTSAALQGFQSGGSGGNIEMGNFGGPEFGASNIQMPDPGSLGVSSGKKKGGGLFGLKLPFFAEGGIVTRPTLAVIGEGSKPEGVFPLDKAKDFGFGGGKSTRVEIFINEAKLNSPSNMREFVKMLKEDLARDI